MELFCAFCIKKIVDDGVIAEGKPYHRNCLRKEHQSDYEKACDDLSKMAPGLPDGVIESIIQAEEPKMIEDLRGPWTVVYQDDLSEYRTDSYPKKAAMIRDLEEWATDVLNGLSDPWEIEYILFHGKLRYDADEIADKLSIKLKL